jgi:hypothetical protein
MSTTMDDIKVRKEPFLYTLVHHRAFFIVTIIITVLKIILGIVFQFPHTAFNLSLFGQQYLVFGSTIYPVYFMLTILIFVELILRVLGNKLKFFYNEGFSFENSKKRNLLVKHFGFNYYYP